MADNATMIPKLTNIGQKYKNIGKKYNPSGCLRTNFAVTTPKPEPAVGKMMNCIDIGKIVRNRFGNFPQFLEPLLRRFIRQDFINAFLSQGYEGTEFCTECLKYLNVTLDVEGLENLPDEPCTIVCTHPLGGVDAVAMLSVAGQKYSGNIKLIANDFLMNLDGLAPFLVPVNKIGTQSSDISDRIDAMFASDCQTVVFPAGKVARKRGGVITEQDWKPTFLRKSLKYGRDVIPVHFYGRNTWRFYLADWISNLFHSKFPIAMALLPDELYRSQGKTYRIVIGEPVPAFAFDGSKSIKAWTEWLRDKACSL